MLHLAVISTWRYVHQYRYFHWVLLGLLALGNVIAALGDEKQRGAHVNYRSELFVVDKSDALWSRTAKSQYDV